MGGARAPVGRLAYVGTLAWDEWSDLDLDLQRLYVLLDYEQPALWFPRILCNPKYSHWIAKLVLECLRQWDVWPGAAGGGGDA